MTNTTDALVALTREAVQHARRHGFAASPTALFYFWTGSTGHVEFEVISEARAEVVVRVYGEKRGLLSFHDLNGSMMVGSPTDRDADFLDELESALVEAKRSIR